MQSIGVFCATVAYCGRFPVAPGTVGSGAGLIVYSLIRMSGSSFIELAVVLALWMLGVWASTISEKYFETVDPSPVVIDEVVGMLVTAHLFTSWMARRGRWISIVPTIRHI